MTDGSVQLSERQRRSILEDFEARLEGRDADEAEALAREAFATIAVVREEFRGLETCVAYYRAKARGLTR